MLLIDEEFNWVDVEIPDFARWPALTSESDSARECLATPDIAQVDAPVESQFIDRQTTHINTYS
jgi:hypothetical protein